MTLSFDLGPVYWYCGDGPRSLARLARTANPRPVGDWPDVRGIAECARVA